MVDPGSMALAFTGRDSAGGVTVDGGIAGDQLTGAKAPVFSCRTRSYISESLALPVLKTPQRRLNFDLATSFLSKQAGCLPRISRV
jgi:hypothetical protein